MSESYKALFHDKFLLEGRQRRRLNSDFEYVANLKFGSVLFHNLSMQEVHHAKTQKCGKRDFKID